jgi:ABC-type bacteriocin/lantibiotic exporter with double-glycine peptidase domain
MALVNVVNTVAFAAILFVLDPYVGLAAIAVVAAMALVTLVLLRWRRSLQKRADDDYTALAGHTARILESIESIKAAAWEQHVFGCWARRRARSARSVSRLGVADQFLALIPAVAMALGLGVVLAVASWQVVQGEMTVGSLVAAQSFVALLLGSAGMVSMMGGLVQNIVSSARQSDVVFREPLDPEVQPRDVTAPSPTAAYSPALLSGAVEVRGLTFGYVPDATPLIDGLDLSIRPGARVALVGRSGSGKTTIAKLVVGELQPWSGEVALDGVARLRLDRATIVRSVAYVPQQSVLFPGTIRENLTLWDSSITDDALHQAITDACISTAIAARPGGLHARVASEESGFSGGEMQRLSLARALANDPKVLVLDEATSALDPVVEHQVDANLRRRGCTCLIVAHRLSTVRDADEIVVLERGRIVQRGQYDDIKDHGFFSELIHG